MEFEFTTNFYMTNDEVNYIINLVNDGFTVDDAIEQWALGITRYDYYVVQIIKNDIIKSINERIEEMYGKINER